MVVARIVENILANFERLLRWIFPGLLLWLVLPIAATSGRFDVSSYRDFYEGLSIAGNLAVIATSGFFIYMVQRYVVHDIVLYVLHLLGVGATANRPGGYSRGFGRHLWRRFGERPSDAHQAENEDRFGQYLTSRWAAVHALSSTWIIGIVLYFVGVQVSHRSVFTGWPDWGTALYGLALFAVFSGYLFQTFLMLRSEQHHYADA